MPRRQLFCWVRPNAKKIPNGGVSIHLPPLEKGGRGGFRTGNGAKNPPSPPFFKGGD